MTAPVLQTERLTLRPMLPEDFPAYAAVMAEPRAAFMGGPYGLRDAWGLFCHDAAGWGLFGFGGLMIDVDGATVGQVGINHGPLFPEPELGWLLYPGHEGRGFATEAAQALRDWAYQHGLSGLVSYTDADNLRSIRVAQRLGAVLDPVAARQDPEDLVWRHPGRIQ